MLVVLAIRYIVKIKSPQTTSNLNFRVVVNKTPETTKYDLGNECVNNKYNNCAIFHQSFALRKWSPHDKYRKKIRTSQSQFTALNEF